MKLTLTALLALPLAACGSFNVEADQPLACLTLQTESITIGGGTAPIVGPIVQAWPEQERAIPLGDAIPTFILDGSPQNRVIHLVSFGIQSTSGVTNLNWLQNFSVSVSPNGGTPVPLVTCQGCVPAGAAAINVPASNGDYNLADLLDANGNLTLSFGGTVNVPAGTTVPNTFGGRVSVCISAKVKKTFDELINGK
jgi:hypothetical protein